MQKHVRPGIGRRSFLTSAALASASLAARSARAETRPNILLITTDQQWAGAMSCAGNPYVKTPNMDRLAANGVRFEAAYSANPICVPSRTSYMTGTPSHVNGIVTNMRDGQAAVTHPCLAKVFQDQGYDTGYVGKWHIPRSADDKAWSGINYFDDARNNGVDPNIPGRCADFLNQHRDAPFFLVASFINPHDVCEWARRLSGIEDDLPNGEIGAPPAPEDCPPLPANRAIPDGEPPVIRQHQADPNMAKAYPTRTWAPDDPRWRQYLWGYYRMVERVDRHIGELLEALRASGQEENTAIVFTSDHGDGLGAHRWNQKTIFYDEVACIPFIVSWKGHTAPGVVDRSRLVNLGTDLFPTLFEIAGIAPPEGLTGLSAAGTALGRADAPAHPFIVAENNHHSGVGNPTTVHGRMLRSVRYKYIRYNTGEPAEQLFDLEQDPGETRSLVPECEARNVLEDHRRMLNQYIESSNDNFPPHSLS
jgi:arylsulfatase A-like enzyme